jgi:hypothetical protein
MVCLLGAILLPLVCAGGCGEKLYNSLNGINTIVVAPAMNLSTNPDIDLVEVTNTFFSELQQVQGLTVVPLGRVKQFLTDNKMATVGSPEEAKQLAAAFKAQACIVLAVTEYDSYNPPRVGLAMQMYTVGGLPAASGTPGFNPVDAERSAVPFNVPAEVAAKPRDSISLIFSGRNDDVEQLAKKYSQERMADNTPFGWRRSIVDQHEFLRLCSYGMIREMMGKDGRRTVLSRINIGSGSGNWPK